MSRSTSDHVGAPHTQYIGILENLAAAVVAFSLPDVLREQLVLHFIDNQGALSNLVSGTSRDADSRRIVYASALQLARLSCRVWYEWVASAANIADLPSRDEFSFVSRMRDAQGQLSPSRFVRTVFPPHLAHLAC